MFEEINTILNFALIILVAFSIFYCWKLNKRLQQLDLTRTDLNSTRARLEEINNAAKDNILSLRKSNNQVLERLAEATQAANQRILDLEAATRAAHKILERLQVTPPHDLAGSVSDDAGKPPEFSTELAYQQEMESYCSINTADKHVLEPPLYSNYYDTLKTIKLKRD